VLAAAECSGNVKVYDIRAPHRAMLTQKISSVDVNVLAWNRLVANLVATGDDHGTLCVWDLRNFKDPLARFTCHQTPITSVEWHPTDESMLIASDDNGVYIYDLSVEEEDSASDIQTEELPAQLLFIHSGSRQYKEAHWHPQITSCCMTTALSGFSVFIPSNL
jgi:ribosome assembly protein RRB1